MGEEDSPLGGLDRSGTRVMTSREDLISKVSVGTEFRKPNSEECLGLKNIDVREADQGWRRTAAE